MVVITGFIMFSRCNICANILDLLQLIDFSPHNESYLLLLHMPGNILLTVRHYEFYLAGS